MKDWFVSPWYMGYDTGTQAGEDGSSPSGDFKRFCSSEKLQRFMLQKSGFVIP